MSLLYVFCLWLLLQYMYAQRMRIDLEPFKTILEGDDKRFRKTELMYYCTMV